MCCMAEPVRQVLSGSAQLSNSRPESCVLILLCAHHHQGVQHLEKHRHFLFEGKQPSAGKAHSLVSHRVSNHHVRLQAPAVEAVPAQALPLPAEALSPLPPYSLQPNQPAALCSMPMATCQSVPARPVQPLPSFSAMMDLSNQDRGPAAGLTSLSTALAMSTPPPVHAALRGYVGHSAIKRSKQAHVSGS